METDKARVLKTGFDSYITKPINIPQFCETINRYLKYIFPTPVR